eukprot:8672177-Pyramimonas_sp.AAC.1
MTLLRAVVVIHIISLQLYKTVEPWGNIHVCCYPLGEILYYVRLVAAVGLAGVIRLRRSSDSGAHCFGENRIASYLITPWEKEAGCPACGVSAAFK